MNKFKVGDKVKSILKEEYHGVRYGDIGEVQEDSSVPYVKWGRIEEIVAFKEEDLIKLYTYENLKKCPVGTKVTFENGRTFVRASESDYRTFTDISGYRCIEDLKGLKDNWNGGVYGKIIKIEEPKYTTVYEAKTEILDEEEKRYLRGVIRPFRDKVDYIVKQKSGAINKEYILIHFPNNINISFPYFKPNTMYKGMTLDKAYTLEELGL